MIAVDTSTSLKQQQKQWSRLDRAKRQLNEQYDWNAKINKTGPLQWRWPMYCKSPEKRNLKTFLWDVGEQMLSLVWILSAIQTVEITTVPLPEASMPPAPKKKPPL